MQSDVSSTSSVGGAFLTHAKTKKQKAEFKNRLDSPTMRAAMALEKFTGNQDNEVMELEKYDDDGNERYISRYTRNEDIALDNCDHLE